VANSADKLATPIAGDALKPSMVTNTLSMDGASSAKIVLNSYFYYSEVIKLEDDFRVI